jgi:hypothetical protein
MIVRSYLKAIWYAYVALSTLLVSMFLLLAAYGAFLERTLRAELPNGAYLNRAHPFSDQIVLRAPRGQVVVRDVAYILFNDRYVAGERHLTPYDTGRFVYRVGDAKAVLDIAGADDPFEGILAASGLEEKWPWGPEDPNWLDFRRLLVRLGYRSPFPE